MTYPTPTPAQLCPQCGAHLANWREIKGEKHYCPEPEETMEQALADAYHDIGEHDREATK